jgi:hypothetical protein
VRPQDARPQRAVSKAPPSAPVHQGDLICGECGEGNASTRRFCSRCGASLATAKPVRLSWWRRMFPKKDKRAAAKAGTAAAARARKKRTLPNVARGIRSVVAVVLLVGGILYGALAPVRNIVNDKVSAGTTKIESIVHPQYVPVHPIEAQATGQTAGHPAGATIDGFTNTFWATKVTGPEQVLIVRFDHPVQPRKALIRVGVSGNFGSTARPHAVHVVFTTGRSQDINLDDKADPQEISLNPGGNVTGIEFHITSVYPAVSSDQVAITEIELFSKK